MKLQNLPVGIQNFEKLRKEGYLYVDKTAMIYELVTSGRYYFLSRPRRFGKSLLLSTLHAYFEGKRELFEGLAIEKLEQKWTKYPVIHLDLNTCKYDKPEALTDKLDCTLHTWEVMYRPSHIDKSLAGRFEILIRTVYEQTGRRVVILVDEFDKPMHQAIGNKDLQESYRNTLIAFFGVLKSMDGRIKFAMLTGITKFGMADEFGGLNNLSNISMLRPYHDICGINEEEIDTYFTPYVERLAEEQEMTVEEVRDTLRRKYGGYHFTHRTKGVYNPFSLLNAFDARTFGNYWFETGTPSYLVYLLRQHDYNLEQIANTHTTEDVLRNIDTTSLHPVPFIYQSGYLTIKGYEPRFNMCELGFPNEEVEEGFRRLSALG